MFISPANERQMLRSALIKLTPRNRQVYNLIVRYPGSNRKQLAQYTGIPTSTVAAACKELQRSDVNLVHETNGTFRSRL